MILPDPKSLEDLFGAEVSIALERSVHTSLVSMASLRQALSDYTHHEKMRGMSLDKVIASVLMLVTAAENARPSESADAMARDLPLQRQLTIWCCEDYGLDLPLPRRG